MKKLSSSFLIKLIAPTGVVLALLVSCKQETSVVPKEQAGKAVPKIQEQSASVSDLISVTRMEFRPSSGIPGQTKVFVDVWTEGVSEIVVGDAVVKFGGVQGAILAIQQVTRLSLTRYTVLVPDEAETGKITVTNSEYSHISDADFKIHDIPTDGLVAFYPFDNNPFTTTDKTVYDISANLLHGTSNNYQSRSADHSGYPLSALYFNGSTYINMGNPLKLQFTGKMTIAAWINYASTDISTGPFVSKLQNNPISGYVFQSVFRPGDKSYGFHVPTWPVSTSLCNSYISGNIVPWQWTFVVVTVDGSTVKLYQDGQMVSSTTNGCGLTNTSVADFKIGMGPTAPNFFKGFIDNVAVYSRVLTDADVLQLFQYPN